MAEFSGLWTTGGGAGDQVASYTQSQLSDAFRVIAACSGYEGVAPGYLNELAVSSPAANTARVASGGAMVDGKFYVNDSDLDVTINSAGAGLERIDAIVLRANWSNFEVSVHKIVGTDAAPGNATPPAITQTSEATYDILLAHALVDDAGGVAVTDQRVWALVDVDNVTLEHVTGALRLKNDGVTNAKLRNSAATSVIGRSSNSPGDPADIAASANDRLLARVSNVVGFVQATLGMFASNFFTADSTGRSKFADGIWTTAKLGDDSVDDTKAGNRVPQFYRRQGGSATDWTTAGTTTRTPGAVRMQAGVVGLAFGVSDQLAVGTITYPTSFTGPPLIFAQYIGPPLDGATRAVVEISNISATGCDVKLRRTDITNGAITGNISWLAIGPE